MRTYPPVTTALPFLWISLGKYTECDKHVILTSASTENFQTAGTSGTGIQWTGGPYFPFSPSPYIFLFGFCCFFLMFYLKKKKKNCVPVVCDYLIEMY